MTDPLADIENRQGNIDMGLMAVRVFQGAQQEATGIHEAFLATVAFFIGMFRGNRLDDPPDET